MKKCPKCGKENVDGAKFCRYCGTLINQENQADNTEVVLNILGDTTGTSISPVTEGGIGTAVNWKDLKNKDGENIVNECSVSPGFSFERL